MLGPSWLGVGERLLSADTTDTAFGAGTIACFVLRALNAGEGAASFAAGGEEVIGAIGIGGNSNEAGRGGSCSCVDG